VVAGLLLSSPALAQPPPGGAYPELAPLLTLVHDFAAPLRFLFVLLFSGAVLTCCARWLALRGEPHREGYAPDSGAARRLAVGYAAAWFLAAAAALHAVGFTWLPEFALALLRAVGTVLFAVAIAAAAAALGLSLGVRDPDLALSLIGWPYLTFHPQAPRKNQPLDLGDGRTGSILRVDLLHTTFDLGGGQAEVRPNAWLMRTHFHWGHPPKPGPDSTP
jgi:hypothetical protein